MEKKTLLVSHHLFELFMFLCDSFHIYSTTECISVWRAVCTVCIRVFMVLGGEAWGIARCKVWHSFIVKINTEHLPFIRLCIRSLRVLKKIRLGSSFQRGQGEEKEGGLPFTGHLLCARSGAKHCAHFVSCKQRFLHPFYRWGSWEPGGRASAWGNLTGSWEEAEMGACACFTGKPDHLFKCPGGIYQVR